MDFAFVDFACPPGDVAALHGLVRQVLTPAAQTRLSTSRPAAKGVSTHDGAVLIFHAHCITMQRNVSRQVRKIVCAALIAAGARAEAAQAFRPLFDGKTLAGWETPDPSYWTVEDGAITARITKEHPCTVNQYLVWRGGELADFELKLKSRVNGEGGINNGFQFRSRLLPDHDVCGYSQNQA